jgi:AraC-like DNA-binding protein
MYIVGVAPAELDLSFISKQVLEGDYYFHDLDPPSEVPLAVVCGGRELCGEDYLIDRDGFRYHSVEYVAAGSGTVVLGGRPFALRPGSVFRYGPGVAHRITADGSAPMVKYFVDFAGALAGDLLHRGAWAELRPLRLAQPARLGALFDELHRLGRRPAAHSTRRCVLLLEQILLTASDEAVPDEGTEHAAWTSYERCRSLMEQRFSQLPSLAAVAEECGVSETHLCRLFQRFDSLSPYQLLVRLKMARAATLLLDRALLVREVGQQVGYDDPYHFSKAFKRVYSLSPGTFRARGRI